MSYQLGWLFYRGNCPEGRQSIRLCICRYRNKDNSCKKSDQWQRDQLFSVSGRTLVCRRGWKCHVTLQCKCSLPMMMAGSMFELNSHFKHSRAQSSFIHNKLIFLPWQCLGKGVRVT